MSEVSLERAAAIYRSFIPATIGQRPDFILNGPAKLTYRKGQRYTKKAFIGEEQFVLYHVYAGKKALIFVFLDANEAGHLNEETDVSEDFPRIEMTAAEAKNLLTNFPEWEEIFRDGMDDMTTENTRKEVAAKENAAHEEALKDPFVNPHWGSW